MPAILGRAMYVMSIPSQSGDICSVGLLDSLAAFWSKVSQEFSSNPYILGYDIINEPWAGKSYNSSLY